MDTVMAIVFLGVLICIIVATRILVSAIVRKVNEAVSRRNRPRQKTESLSTHLYFSTPTSSPETIHVAVLHKFSLKPSSALKITHEQTDGEYYSLTFRCSNKAIESIKANLLIQPGTQGNGAEGKITVVSTLDMEAALTYVAELSDWRNDVIAAIQQADNQVIFTQTQYI